MLTLLFIPARGHLSGSVLKNGELVLLPTAGVRINIDDNGDYSINSVNGRYIFSGVLDTWSGRQLESMNDAITSVTTIPHTQRSPDWSAELQPIIVGNIDKPVVTIFVDPLCSRINGTESCERLFEEILNSVDYQFHMIPVSMAPESEQRVKQINCLLDEKRVEALLNERLVLDVSLKSDECNEGMVLSRLVAYRLIGNTHGFLFISPNGKRHDRLPPHGILNWLEGA